MPVRVAIISVLPSPYQRDLFEELSNRPEISLEVFYLEQSTPDSPWPAATLEEYETILPGICVPVGSARCHYNWGLPDFKQFDLVIMNSLMSFTAQIAIRWSLRKRRWIFWGERFRGGNFLHRIIAAPLHKAAAIAGIGTLACNDYRKRYPEPRHFNIPYFCNLAPFQKAAQKRRHRKEFVFFFCGQMIARKGLETLIAAFIRLAAENEQARLFLVGRDADLDATLDRFPYCEQIEYNGFQSPTNLPQSYSEADAFVLPSLHDGWGVVVNQALGAGLPIICSEAVGAAHDLVEPEVNGLIVPTGNVEALYQAMKRLADNRELATRWGAASLEKSHAWTPEAGADRWIKAILELL